MYFFIKFITLLVFSNLVLIPYYVNAQIPIEEMKGTHSILKPEYQQQFSPLVGLTSNETIDNIYKFGKDDDPIVKLVRMLLYQSDANNITIGSSSLPNL